MPVPLPTTLFGDTYWNRIRLHWTASSGATGYRLWRKITSDPDSNLVLIYDGVDLSFTDFPVALDYTSGSNPQRSWKWVLAPYNDDGEGDTRTVFWDRPDIANSSISGMELLHPSYNDGSDKTASYSDTSKSGSGGASDPSANEALLYHDQLWTNAI